MVSTENDAAMLKNLQHRRVADLIGSNIPDEEAKLLKNGRLTCLICNRRPIFDTLTMLSVHRKGKKHILELSKHLTQKRELERRKLKKDQEIYLRTDVMPKEERDVPCTSSGKQLLTRSVPYNSCVKRHKGNQFQGVNRRHVLDLHCIDSEPSGSNLPIINNVLPSATSEVRHYLKDLRRKKTLKKTVDECRANYGMKVEPSAPCETLTNKPSSSTPTTCKSSTPAMSDQAKHELKLRISGWIKDSDGNWVKDPAVEFDSDEDEPPKLYS